MFVVRFIWTAGMRTSVDETVEFAQTIRRFCWTRTDTGVEAHGAERWSWRQMTDPLSHGHITPSSFLTVLRDDHVA